MTKTLIVIEDSQFSEVKTVRTVRCTSYRIYKHPPTASYWTLEVTRLNGNIDSFIHMTEVHEIVWRRKDADAPQV